MGLCYVNGGGVKKSLKKAAEAFRSTAEQGCLKTMVAWGRSLDSGFGTDPESREAGPWMKMVALHQNETARKWLREKNQALAGGHPIAGALNASSERGEYRIKPC